MRLIGTRHGTLVTMAFILLAGMTIAAFAQDATPADSDNPQPTGQPVIQVDNAEHDFGSVWSGPKLTHTFKITNAGTAPLKILSIKLTCDCTEAAKTPESLAPGETGDFPFVLDTKKVRNVYRRTILILSNDPVTPTLQLAVKGESKQRIQIEPAGAYFGILSGSEPQTRVIRITNNMDAPLKLTFGGLPANAQFAFELQETTPGKQYELRVATVPPYTPGELQALIGLRTNLAEEPAISVRAYARVPDRVDVVPTMILVPKTEANDKGHTTLMRLTNYGTPPVKLVEVVTPNAAITSTIIENEANEQYTVRVEFPAGYVPPETGAAITLRTNDAEKSTFEIPLKPGATRSQRPVATQPTVRKQRPAMDWVGEAAPTFSAATVAGEPVSNETLVAHAVTILNFVAPNCGHCRKQIPNVNELCQEYTAKGVRFVNMGQTMGGTPWPDDKMRSTLESLGPDFELVIDSSNTIGRTFKATAFPTMIVVTRSGTVEHVNIGSGLSPDALKSQLDALLKNNGPATPAGNGK